MHSTSFYKQCKVYLGIFSTYKDSGFWTGLCTENKQKKPILLQFTQPSYINVLLDTSLCCQVVKPIEVFSRKSFFTWKSPAWAHHLDFTARITTLVLLGITISLFLLMSEEKVSALLSITTLYFKWTAVTISALQNETDSKN